ncbi:MAG: hypothetical protein WCY89_02480 [Flavobacteriaceae bacterium]
MFSKKITYLIIFTGIVILAVMFFNPYSYNSPNITIKDEFYESYQTDVSMREDYKEKCDFENKNAITFPRTKPDKVFLHSNGLIKYKRRLDQNHVDELLTILNDSANYVWGEFGTPEFQYYFTFVNAENKIIGITKIDLIGMAYSEPYIAKMKWGQLDKMEKLHNLIYDIEDNSLLVLKYNH